ncbi:GIY-YIG nuclease family protein, partial [Methylobacterium sp. J-072]|uniref:GIY-YIG nuclease family protein n=1 Tax=Methylobacterium sp. J-072 TaxID=2836651 RepID=UPI001FB97603
PTRRNGRLYTGVTACRPRRAYEHREALRPGLTRRYGCKPLVWYEGYPTMSEAIARETQSKAGSRKKQLALIEAMNPDRCDLYPGLA